MVSKRKNQRATLIHAHRRSRQLLVPRPVLLLLLLCGLVFVLFFLLFLGAALRVAIRHSSNVFEQEINGLFGACSPSLSSDAGADTSVAATRTVLIFLCVCVCATLSYYDPYMYIQVIELGLSRLEKQRLGLMGTLLFAIVNHSTNHVGNVLPAYNDGDTRCPNVCPCPIARALFVPSCVLRFTL